MVCGGIWVACEGIEGGGGEGRVALELVVSGGEHGGGTHGVKFRLVGVAGHLFFYFPFLNISLLQTLQKSN